ncbi:energy transducer TonB [Chitinophaga polysaccharea]|uniref:energy transducer TonB n=1 Tax=Chitinophaga polysaccharea TaxID=1293035 RepID=UPI001159D35B|nr:TonB family protein [Chitinophaga polysaccharea]
MTDKRPHIKPEELAGLIRQYLAGELDDKAMHALERQALDDPFLADALEGYALHTPEQAAHQEELAFRLSERIASRGRIRPMIYRAAAAAAILLLMFSAGWFLWNQQQTAPIAGVNTPESSRQASPVFSEHGDTAPATANADHLAKKSTPATPAAPETAKKQQESQEQATEATDRIIPYVQNEKVNETIPSTNKKVPDLSGIPAVTPGVQAERREDQRSFVPSEPGKKDTQIRIRGQNSLALGKPDSQRSALNEVVVIGYGVQKKQNVTGSVSVLQQNSITDSAQVVVAGRVAGLEVSSDADNMAYRAPAPVTGETAFENYLKTKTVNPENKYSGTVRVSFIVMPDGSLQDFKIIRHLNEACDAEAIRVIKEGPAWIPASDGKPAKVKVRVKFTIKKDK